MKMQNTNLFIWLDKNELSQLTTQVKETLAQNCTYHKTVFGAVDLWNIQKMKRATRTSRRLFV